MFKIKNFKVEIKHLLMAVSAIGMLTGFILSVCSKKKTAPIIVFVTSFASFLAGFGMEAGLVPAPSAKKMEIEVDPEESDEDEGTDEENPGSVEIEFDTETEEA